MTASLEFSDVVRELDRRGSMYSDGVMLQWMTDGRVRGTYTVTVGGAGAVEEYDDRTRAINRFLEQVRDMRKILGLLKAPAAVAFLQPIASAPKDGSYILVAGPSGYGSMPLRFEACKWSDGNWRNHGYDHYSDGGGEPVWWMPLPKAPL